MSYKYIFQDTYYFQSTDLRQQRMWLIPSLPGSVSSEYFPETSFFCHKNLSRLQVEVPWCQNIFCIWSEQCSTAASRQIPLLKTFKCSLWTKLKTKLQVFSWTKCASFHVAAPPFSPGWLSLETQVSSPSFKTSLRFLLFLLRRGIGQMCHLGLKNNIGCRESEAKRTMGRNGSSGDVSFSFIWSG